MSPAEVVRAHFGAFVAGGLDSVAEYWDPEIVWRAVEGAADDSGPIRGREAVRRYYDDWIESLDDLHAEVDEILFESGDRVAAVVRNRGRGRASGVPVHGRYFVACTVRDGRIVAGGEYATPAAAIEAARD